MRGVGSRGRTAPRWKLKRRPSRCRASSDRSTFAGTDVRTSAPSSVEVHGAHNTWRAPDVCRLASEIERQQELHGPRPPRCVRMEECRARYGERARRVAPWPYISSAPPRSCRESDSGSVSCDVGRRGTPHKSPFALEYGASGCGGLRLESSNSANARYASESDAYMPTHSPFRASSTACARWASTRTTRDTCRSRRRPFSSMVTMTSYTEASSHLANAVQLSASIGNRTRYSCTP